MSKLSICLLTAIIDFTIFILLTLVTIMFIYYNIDKIEKKFTDSCFSTNPYSKTIEKITESLYGSSEEKTTVSSHETTVYTQTTSSTTTNSKMTEHLTESLYGSSEEKTTVSSHETTVYTQTSSSTTTTTIIDRLILDSNMTAAVGDWYPWELCPVNSFAIGFNLKIDLSTDDKTALNTVKLICNDPLNTTIVSYDGFRGVWGNDVYCPNNTRIIGFKYRYDRYDGKYLKIDDTSGNSAYFYCEDNIEIKPTLEATEGTWTTVRYCPSGYAVCGIIVQYQADQGTGELDDTALNNLKLKCCNI